MILPNLKKLITTIVLILVILLSAKLTAFSQRSLTNDSICFTKSEATIILTDLAKLKQLKKSDVAKDSIIFNYVQLDSLRVDRINEYNLEVNELTKESNKRLKRLKTNRKLFFVAGFVAILELFILIVG